MTLPLLACAAAGALALALLAVDCAGELARRARKDHHR